MSHYDCSNCGYAMGIDFGSCEKCTPKEYFELKREAELISRNAHANADKELAEARKSLIKKHMSDLGMEDVKQKMKEIEASAKRNQICS